MILRSLRILASPFAVFDPITVALSLQKLYQPPPLAVKLRRFLESQLYSDFV